MSICCLHARCQQAKLQQGRPPNIKFGLRAQPGFARATKNDSGGLDQYEDCRDYCQPKGRPLRVSVEVLQALLLLQR